MFKSLTINTAFVTLFTVLFGFLLLNYTVPPRILIVGLNGVFVGTVCSILIAFYPLVRDIVKGTYKFDNVDQMALGLIFAVVCFCSFAGNSIYYRTGGIDTLPSPFSTFGRYMSILAMIFMITAPYRGKGFFYGRNQRLLWASLFTGLIVSLVIMFMQEAV